MLFYYIYMQQEIFKNSFKKQRSDLLYITS